MRYFFIAALCVSGLIFCMVSERNSLFMLSKIKNSQDVCFLFPKTIEAIQKQSENALSQAQKGIDRIVSLADNDRTYENTVLALDRITGKLGTDFSALYSLCYVHPDPAMIAAANKAVVAMQEFMVDTLSHNVDLYNALQSYAQNNAQSEQLNSEEKKFLYETLKDFKKGGLALPKSQQEEIKVIKKELAHLGVLFSNAINSDKSFITVSADALKGCDDSFVNALEKDENGLYRLGVDYPTYFSVMENCSVESTRKDLYRAFNKRAYPANEKTLKEIIAKRDVLAKKLGFVSYAHMDIDDAMAKTPERVQEFLDDLQIKSRPKMVQELNELKSSLPEGVTLTEDGLFKPWDFNYIKAQYKKNHLALDEELVKEYFPMEKTVEEILDIYKQFLGVEFRQEKVSGFWHETVEYISVYKDGVLLGHLLMDLYPRENKYGHACQIGIAPAVRSKSGEHFPPVILVIANFSKPTKDRPSLLKRNEVETFFHEFGHAMHSLFGATEHAGFAGTNVKHDFVEVPSQMLEEWMFDAQMLKKVSSHYKTGESLSDEVIEKINKIKRFDSGYFVFRQVMLSKLALSCFAPGENKDPYALKQECFEPLCEFVMFDDQNHFEASFGHLHGYAAKYYSYLWSKVYALDLFEQVKKQGLLDSAIGQKYIDEVIGKGGSVDPDILMKNFLGREPSSEAFFKDLGLQ